MALGLHQDGDMRTPRESEIHDTAAASRVLFQLRLRHSCEIPMPVWEFMARAEARLNREIAEYFADDVPVSQVQSRDRLAKAS
jgi:hypothetical protein